MVMTPEQIREAYYEEHSNRKWKILFVILLILGMVSIFFLVSDNMQFLSQFAGSSQSQNENQNPPEPEIPEMPPEPPPEPEPPPLPSV